MKAVVSNMIGNASAPENRPIMIALGFLVAILLVGTIYTLVSQGTAPLLSPRYQLQQLQTGAFLGIVAAGMMLVILLGHIDLSIPWTMAAAAIIATSVGGAWAIPAGLGVGLAVGMFNGFGVAVLRVPSMIFTLGVNAVMQGIVVLITGGFAPQTAATPLMQYLASGKILSVPVAVFIWVLVCVLVSGMLVRTAFGRSIYATGNRESAAYLSGIRTRIVIIGAFALCGMLAGLSGVLLAGYSTKAYQGMGDPFLLPAIAAVVIGGTRILGGQGRFAGTVVGVLLIVLLNSVLSIMQMPEAGRQIIYGTVIITMLLTYGRTAQVTS